MEHPLVLFYFFFMTRNYRLSTLFTVGNRLNRVITQYCDNIKFIVIYLKMFSAKMKTCATHCLSHTLSYCKDNDKRWYSKRHESYITLVYTKCSLFFFSFINISSPIFIIKTAVEIWFHFRREKSIHWFDRGKCLSSLWLKQIYFTFELSWVEFTLRELLIYIVVYVNYCRFWIKDIFW